MLVAVVCLPTLAVVYLDMVTRVGLGRASRNSRTAATSPSISSSVLTWWGSSTVSQVKPAWWTWERAHARGGQRPAEEETQRHP